MKIICVGRNYAAHAKELNNDVPTEPVLFLKPKSALLAPGAPMYYPEFTKDLHYECELVVKIGKNGKMVSEQEAGAYYNEVSVGLDFTARDLQDGQKKKGLPWEIAKAFDGSAAVGTFVPLTGNGVQDLSFSLKQNDAVVQDGHTGDMLFSVNQIIAYASRFFSMNIGDLIFTGTPPGVGPVAVHDRLECSLNGQPLLEVFIK